MKNLSLCFLVLAVILSHIMCAVTAFRYCDMIWGIRYAGYSAPAWTALLSALPFLAGIAVCVVLAFFLKKKGSLPQAGRVF